jgi:hypothetical protein
MVLARVGKAKGQTLDGGEHHHRSRIAELPQVLAFCYALLCFPSFQSRGCVYAYICCRLQRRRLTYSVSRVGKAEDNLDAPDRVPRLLGASTITECFVHHHTFVHYNKSKTEP